MAHSSNETQTSPADLLLDYLKELSDDELKEFKWKLSHTKLKPLPRGQVKDLDRTDLADKMISSYSECDALNVMLEILKNMNMNDLAQRLNENLQEGPQAGSELGDMLEQSLEVRKMGGSSSTERVETEVKEDRNPSLLKEPWRNIVWDHSTRTKLKKYLQDYKPTVDSVPKARILLVGVIGAGKSSFFNSINSVCRGNMTSQAKAGSDATCMTMQYRTYTVRAGRGGRPLAFLLCDTMGLEPAPYSGVHIEDIESILKGYIPDKYQFNPVSSWKHSDGQTKFHLSLKDRIHCVVCLIDATRFQYMRDEMKKKFHEIQRRTNFHDVPLLVLLTQVDNACPHVEKDLRNVYRSCFIKELIKKASECLSVPVLSVLPVKNYTYETELNDSCDILLLSAMKQMLNFADNYLDSWEEDIE